MYSTLSELTDSLQYTLTHSTEGVSIIDATALREKAIDMLVMSAFFSDNQAVVIQSRNIIRRVQLMEHPMHVHPPVLPDTCILTDQCVQYPHDISPSDLRP